jgi:hypothetical protein
MGSVSQKQGGSDEVLKSFLLSLFRKDFIEKWSSYHI